MKTNTSIPTEHLTADDWQTRANQHQTHIDTLLGDYTAKRSKGIKQPVLDFLFQYYSLPVSRLRRWVPGFHQALHGPQADTFLDDGPYHRHADGTLRMDPAAFPLRRRRTIDWVTNLLTATAANTPSYTCYGLHEWAMVYQTTDPRHAHLPLRLGAEATNTVVDQHCIRCTHYDAYRFFTEPAIPLNTVQPTLDDCHHHEQPACLHANMDLYRWAFKLHPWLGSDLLRETFALAVQIRQTDMAASPYDLTAHGIPPIPIETPAGKIAYTRLQKKYHHQATPLRQKLINHYQALSTWLNTQPT